MKPVPKFLIVCRLDQKYLYNILVEKKIAECQFVVPDDFEVGNLSDVTKVIFAPGVTPPRKRDLERHSQTVLENDEFDFLVLKQNQLWPENSLSLSAMKFISSQVKSLQSGRIAMIAGIQAMPFTFVQLLSRLGFNDIRFIVDLDETLEAQFAKIRKKHFGVQLSLVKAQELTQMAAVASVLINTVDALDSKVTQNLRYFNFVKAGGLVIDYTFGEALDSPLVKLASEIGLIAFSGESLYQEQLVEIINF